MAIVQDQFYVPEEIMQGLISGKLIRYGGVVRNLSGEIVKHLDSMPIDHNPPKAHFSTGGVIAVAAVGTLVVAATGALAYYVGKTIKLNTNINQELYAYLQAARNGDVTREHIQAVLNALQEAKKKKVKVVITQQNLDDIIETFTRNLAKNNSLQIREEATKQIVEKKGVDKLAYLFTIQEEIFDKVA